MNTMVYLLVISVITTSNSHIEMKKFYSFDACDRAAHFINMNFAKHMATANASEATCISEVEPKSQKNWLNNFLSSNGDE